LRLAADRELARVSLSAGPQVNCLILTNCSDVSLSVFAYRTFDPLPEDDEGTLACSSSGEGTGSEKAAASRARSSGVGAGTDEAPCDSFMIIGSES
jgi:hypothetical protein